VWPTTLRLGAGANDDSPVVQPRDRIDRDLTVGHRRRAAGGSSFAVSGWMYKSVRVPEMARMKANQLPSGENVPF